MIYFTILFGLLFCSFWVAQLIFVKIHLRWTNTLIKSDDTDREVCVSVIHPIKDLDFELDKNLESWMDQNYTGPVQHIFSFQNPHDPAIEMVENLKRKYPEKDIEITINPVTEGLNGKSSNMVNGLKLARYDIVMFGDSDIRIKPDFIVKMVRPLKDEKVGLTTCGQINIGGKSFWTRFFTFMQNSETDFMWAFFTKLGLDVGMTGAAFAMRKEVLQKVGGLEAYGNSLLEDLHLGNTLYKMGYKLVLGPFLECHVNELAKEKSLNYAKRIAIGIKTHIAFELPAFVLMLFWYWIFFILAILLENTGLLCLSLLFMGIRTLHGIFHRLVTMNRVMPVDLVMPLFFDLFGTFYLLYSFNKPSVTWRGIRYDVKKGGYIEAMVIEDDEIKAVE
ncbi:MAG: glycosyltransferase [Clostridiales bacterium]|nr:glycosyltransferase [Eubacteriales bacterium]MDH7565843.1 glycosyltransferase [Clostridiales bacterium]